MLSRPARLALVLVVLLALPLATGCVRLDVPEERVPDWMKPEVVEQTEAEGSSETTDGPTGPEMPFGTHEHGTEVLMMGRSVMQGWFDHWEWNGHNSIKQEGYALYYGELEAPPGIADSAIGYIGRVPDGTVVFFKLCFEDFYADTPGEVAGNLDENLGYVNAVVTAASGRNIKLVLGNALPDTISHVTGPRIDLYRRYNAELDRIAAASGGKVIVFDQYGILANHQGALTKGFAYRPDDAHLSDHAYRTLDEELFTFLDENL